MSSAPRAAASGSIAETLRDPLQGTSIGDVLAMRVDESRAFFDAQPKVPPGLDALHEAGLGYITLGQSSTTLSGGEAQRASSLRPSSGRAPRPAARSTSSTSRPPASTSPTSTRLLTVLHRLADAGNTIVVIEHNLDVIKTADWILDLGPEGGEAGGRLVAEGTPRDVAHAAGSRTGTFLRGV